jgi:hypothetical protein
MTKQQQIAALLAEMQAEDAELRRQGIVQFDGSPTWERFTELMSAEAMATAERLQESGEVVGPPLRDFNRFGSADK